MPRLNLKDCLWGRKPEREDDKDGRGLDLETIQRKPVLSHGDVVFGIEKAVSSTLGL